MWSRSTRLSSVQPGLVWTGRIWVTLHAQPPSPITAPSMHVSPSLAFVFLVTFWWTHQLTTHPRNHSKIRKVHFAQDGAAWRPLNVGVQWSKIGENITKHRVNLKFHRTTCIMYSKSYTTNTICFIWNWCSCAPIFHHAWEFKFSTSILW